MFTEVEHITTSDRNKKLTDHIFNYRQGTEKEKWKWEESLNPQSKPSVILIFQEGSTSQRFHNLPQNILNWDSNFQMPGTMVDISPSCHHTKNTQVIKIVFLRISNTEIKHLSHIHDSF